MTIALTDATLALWSAEYPNGNWMAHLARGAEAGSYDLTVRRRAYVDDKLWPESADELRSWMVRFKSASDAAAIERTRLCWKMLASNSGSEPAWELVRGLRTLDEFVTALAAQPGIHTHRPQKFSPSELGPQP